MSQQTDGSFKTFVAEEALEEHRLVKLSTTEDQVVYCDAGDDPVGVTQAAAAINTRVPVKLLNAPGTFKVEAAGAWSIADVLYAAADGKVDDDPQGAPLFRALEAAGAAGDKKEVYGPVGISQATGDTVEVIGGAGDIVALNLVYASDQTDNIMTVLKAQGTAAGHFADYICPNAITAAAKGVALKKFLLSGIDTSAGSVGDPVYLSDSAAGGYTLTKPTATDKIQIVGRIREDHATTGAILFDLSGPQQIVHTHADASEGGQLDPTAAADYSATQGAVPFVVQTTCTAAGAEDEVVMASWPQKARVVDAWMIARDTNAANVTLKNATNAFTAATAKGGTNDAIVPFGSIIAAYDEIAAAAAVVASFSAAGSVDVCLLCIPIA